MIARLKGTIEEVRANNILLDINNITYEILIPTSILETFSAKEEVVLEILQLFQMEKNKMFPLLIGFRNEIERDFFEQLMTVSGIGAKGAIKALKYPVNQVAIAIDRGDEKFLSTLPGIGKQKARLIIAKLQGKVGKYALIQGGERKTIISRPGINEEALEILLQLQYKKKDALDMINKVLVKFPDIDNVEDLLNLMYKVKVSENGS